jgi:hypothetical protein
MDVYGFDPTRKPKSQMGLDGPVNFKNNRPNKDPKT